MGHGNDLQRVIEAALNFFPSKFKLKGIEKSSLYDSKYKKKQCADVICVR